MDGENRQHQPGQPRLLRAINERAALELLLEHGPLTRPRLGALTGLSKPTASVVLGRLEAAGLVLRTGIEDGGGPGPSAALYELNPAAAFVGGLDVTTARIAAAVADITGRVVGRYELPTPGRSASGAIERARTALDRAAKSAGLSLDRLTHVVAGTPGAIDPTTGKLGYARHLPGWHGEGVIPRLREAFGVSVDHENDVNLTAIAERVHGVAGGARDFIEVWVSEGVGMALVLGGAVHRGATGGAGEVGYMPMPGAPIIRNIGRGEIGGFQAAAGAPAVVKLARECGLDPRSARDAATALARAASTSHRLLDAYAQRLATGLAAIVAVLDPELIVLTGDVLLAGGEPLRSRIEGELRGMAIPRPTLRLSTVAGNPVLAGAVEAALAVARDRVFSAAATASPLGTGNARNRPSAGGERTGGEPFGPPEPARTAPPPRTGHARQDHRPDPPAASGGSPDIRPAQHHPASGRPGAGPTR